MHVVQSTRKKGELKNIVLQIKKSKNVTTSSIHLGTQNALKKFSIMFCKLLKLGTRLTQRKFNK